MLRSAAATLAPYAELLDSLGGLTWPSAVRVRAGDPGSHRSNRLGRSPEFTEYRSYRPGDDLRRLDWKLFGRTDRLFLRIADDHAALRTSIVVDASASMRFPLEGYGKWEHACALALGLTSVAISDGDAVGVTIATKAGEQVVPPRRRRDVLHDIATSFAGVDVGGAGSLVASIERLVTAPRLVVISDFLGEAEQALAALRVAAAAGAEVFAVHVVADSELNPPDRAFLASDPEQPDFRRAMSDESRARYLESFAAWREHIAGSLHAMNGHYRLSSTTEPVRDAVRRVVLSGSAT